jgi:hypothetical protein
MEKENQQNGEMKAEKPADSNSEKQKAKKEGAKDSDQVALARILKALDITEEDLKKIEGNKSKAAEMVEYDVTPTIVKINGVPQPCRGVAPRGVVEQILACVGARRHRLLQEVLGKSVMGEIIGSQFHARVVEVVNKEGEKVSNV